jgi:methionyl-tRNA formyltransferase
MDRHYVVAGSKSWSRVIFDQVVSRFVGKWSFTGSPDSLNALLETLDPRYIFFLHWSWMVPDEIIEKYECVCFHMADVPYGRGGSPLQNLIIRGQKDTVLTALRMTTDLDAGPVYLKRPLSLFGSTAEEIYVRATHLSAEMIEEIIEKEPHPKAQEGEVTLFKRRKPEDSEMPQLDTLEQLFDFIRMLDGEGYTRAFVLYKNFRFEFSRASYYSGKVVADVVITRIEGEE